MARPRIFISSTYYDLKHVRASLDLFVDSLGFEPVLSEKGDIAYTPDRPLDESCYREVENSDVLVLLIGGRYGSEASNGSKKPTPSFFDRYESITRKEYEAAVNKDVPIYILIEKGVYSEYQTFLRNKERTEINYAHVESVNVFILIEDILSKPRNNPVQTFEKFDEIESWLREQWAGLFRELLRRQSQQQQLVGLSAQVTDLKQVNETLKKYLEAVMTGAGKQEASKLIEKEERRLEEAKRLESLKRNRFVSYMQRSYETSFEDFVSILEQAQNLDELLSAAQLASKTQRSIERLKDTLSSSSGARVDLNEARKLAGMPQFDFEKELDRPIRDHRLIAVNDHDLDSRKLNNSIATERRNENQKITKAESAQTILDEFSKRIRSHEMLDENSNQKTSNLTKSTPAKTAIAKNSLKKLPTENAPAKKVPAKKVPAKKVPAKKVPAKKVPAKKGAPKVR